MFDVMTDIECVYGYLVGQHAHALREGDADKATRIFNALDVFHELWPDDVRRWENRIKQEPR